MYSKIRPLLFLMEPERAHAVSYRALRLAMRLPGGEAILRRAFAPTRTPSPTPLFGLNFPNLVGVAAGYDKDALAWRGLAALGFGHVEVGTVTPRPQPGNPKPRVFRLPQDGALINRMGFPNAGAAFVARQLRGPKPPNFVLGVNIGKNKDTPLEAAASDYVSLIQTFAPLADYIAINISSPNTEGLRRLQARETMQALLSACAAARPAGLPLLVKLAPDLNDDELEDALGVCVDTRLDGVILTNTTLRRDGLRAGPELANQKGGLSGAPLRDVSTGIIRRASRLTGGRLPIIGVGGIDSPSAAQEKLDAGAALVQVYTGLVYAGPMLAKNIVDG
ncbi:MAG TPA: quinone-dependent dihydroorotate dehydrogenase, partial [Thermoflexales bacterium]|nr:quinone-dependent dihydroorotate dehydrogenase [Thermoflexales bacterium]